MTDSNKTIWEKYLEQTGSLNQDDNIIPIIKEDEDTENLEKTSKKSVELYENMRILNSALEMPKEEKLSLRFSTIKKHCGEEESYETVRTNRKEWKKSKSCLFCSSNNIEEIDQTDKTKSKYNYRYKCLDCNEEFNDDSDTAFENGVPTIQTWMQCWYLMGCTQSEVYISAKLGLDIKIIQQMIKILKRVFGEKNPEVQNKSYKEWSKESLHIKKRIEEHLSKTQELYQADKATQPKDTAEFRRQQERRRNPNINKK